MAKLMKLVPSMEVNVMLRLDMGLEETSSDKRAFLQRAASAGTKDTMDSGMSQSYT